MQLIGAISRHSQIRQDTLAVSLAGKRLSYSDRRNFGKKRNEPICQNDSRFFLDVIRSYAK